MKVSLRAFQGLRWKLTWPYVVFTPLIMLLIQCVVLAIATLIIILFFMQQLVYDSVAQVATTTRPFFAHGTADRQALQLWSKTPAASTFFSYGGDLSVQAQFSVIVGKDGRAIVSTGTQPLPENSSVYRYLPPDLANQLQRVLASKSAVPGITHQTKDGAIFVIIPITGLQNQVVGAVIGNTGPNLAQREILFWVRYYLPTFAVSFPFFALFGLIVGLPSNIFSARQLIRRFNRLVEAALNWSKGDFSRFIQDNARDEISQLTGTLNRMAEQLQNLLQTRQKVAVLEERQRLARDLHDSVKQHIFVASLQLGAARLQLRQNTDAAEQSLQQAEQVLQQVQQELKTLILQLRPVALDRGLPFALREFAQAWSQQTGCATTIQIGAVQRLPPPVEEAFYRVAQEALANVARHSHASQVQVRLWHEGKQITLSIEDNGKGFNRTTQEDTGFGLHSMQERMQSIGGAIQIKNSTASGTCIIAHYTVQEPQGSQELAEQQTT